MPQSTLSHKGVEGVLGRAIGAEELEEVLFRSKAEVKEIAGDDLKLEVTADRLDLLSEAGLGLHLAGALGLAHGLIAWKPPRGDPALTLRRMRGVAPLRPVINGVIVESPEGAGLDAPLLAEAIRFQELLHATVGRNRRLASLGIYPLERVRPPVTYALEPLDAIRFTPLDADSPVDGKAFFESHAMAAQYGPYGRTDSGCLTLRDAAGEILSLPPVLNSRSAGEARVGDRRLLIESTGTLEGRVDDALALLSLVFIARGWKAAPVPVISEAGEQIGPDPLALRSVPLRESTLRSIAGEAIPANEVSHALSSVRLAAHPSEGGWRVEAPPWRPDLLAEVDLVEEVLLARGLKAESGILPPTRTRGGRRPESRFRMRVADLLLGLGFAPLSSTVLVPGALVHQLGRHESIEVANPVSELYSHLRDRLCVSLVSALGHNVRFGYPQRFSEVGPVVVPNSASESGADSRYHAGFLVASEAAGFADAASIVDYVLGALGTVAVREPTDIPGMIPGRGARVRLAGETVAEVGELHPEILKAQSVPVPVAWAELDLTRLWPLLGRQ
ncbi:MAG TPA: hypothetical protein VEY07_05670 [Thermoplasmata archaeon]|nr:hypothetical protein [Thermoplasmata archaeon]